MIHWKPPTRNIKENLANFVATAEPNVLICYHKGKAFSARSGVMQAAASVEAFGVASLVQFPERPCGGDQSLDREFFYCLQKRAKR